MKALLLKDYYLLKKQLKIVLVVMVFYALLFVPQGMIDMLPFMAVIFAMMYVLAIMSLDETLKWDRYALCGPLTRRDMVNARYLSTLLMMALAFAFGLLCYGIFSLLISEPRSFATSILKLSCASLSSLLGLAIIIPVIYKQGVENSRLLSIGVMLIPVGGIVLYSKYAPPELTLFLLRYAAYFPAFLLLAAVCALIISYNISWRIYNNKDF